MEYVLVIHQAEEGGYWAEVPALEGCFIQGEILDEVLEDAPKAIVSHLTPSRRTARRCPRTRASSSPLSGRPSPQHRPCK